MNGKESFQRESERERLVPITSYKEPVSLQKVLNNRGWLNLRQSAAYLGISSFQLKGLIAEHNIDHTRGAGVYRIWVKSLDELEAIIRNGRN